MILVLAVRNFSWTESQQIARKTCTSMLVSFFPRKAWRCARHIQSYFWGNFSSAKCFVKGIVDWQYRYPSLFVVFSFAVSLIRSQTKYIPNFSIRGISLAYSRLWLNFAPNSSQPFLGPYSSAPVLFTVSVSAVFCSNVSTANYDLD